MYRLVIDLEMNGMYTEEIPMGEIIEIGAVVLNEEFEIVDKYSTYIKPNNLRISQGVQRLTNITEEKLVKAPNIKEALENLLQITPDINNTTLYTWSDSDTNAIECELNSKNIQIKDIKRLCNNYIDIQEIFGERVGIENRLNLTKALNMIGLEFNGREHGALADAINTAQILKESDTNQDIKKKIDNINGYMQSEPLTVSIANLFSNIKLS